ncbi:MAG: hypothetical protein LBS35_02235 [Synergistaceae bacterium]|jgi:hypothetical protein|nr:hypothetical protein [Synergistaceae bacterium]
MTALEFNQDLGNVLALLLEYPGALRVLVGETQAPGPDEFSSLGGKKKTITRKLMRRHGGNTDASIIAAVISRTIESAGGWPHIVKMSRQWIRDHRDPWKILTEYFVFVKPARRGGINGNPFDRLAERHGITADDLIRLVNSFPGELADAIIRGLAEDREK